MTKRKSLIATFAFVLVLSLALFFGITLSDGTLTAQAAGAPSYVTVNAQKLYSGYYLESNKSDSVSKNAETEPANYVAWYKDGILTLNGYNGGQISIGEDLTIKLTGKNTITSETEGIFVSSCENLIIDADSEATLNINVSSSANEVYGICVATTGTVTIKGKATVNINAETSVAHAYGISAKTGFNIVGSANLSIKNKSSNATSGMSYSIASFNNKPLFNTNGVVTLDNSKCANRNYCIGAYGIDMKKGTLICRYKPETIYSYACSQTISTAPEGCVLREAPYSLGETVIKSGSGHTVTVENGLDYYDKNSNQYVDGETVYVKAGIEDLDFDKWEGTGVTFAEAAQKETSFVMGNEDVTIKAVYYVFAKQPVFKRTDKNKGTLSVQLNKQTSDGRSIVLIDSNGEENTKLYFSLDAASDNHTYECKDVWESSVPAGTYKIRVNYNGYYFYSDTFKVDYPFANVSDANVSGKTGREITPVSFDVTLTDATFEEIAADTDVSSWFEYIPNGLVAKINAVSEGATSATITISGTPTVAGNRAIYLNIPKECLATGNDIVITTEYNNGANFSIVYSVSYSITLRDGRSRVDGAYQSSAKEGATVTIKANEKTGYVFDKWVVVSGDVTLADENNKETTFVMPESTVEIKATYKEIVNSVEVFVTAPVKDNTADTTTMSVNSTGYSATKVEWYKGEDVVSSMLMSATDKFIAGESYTVVVTVTLNPGYVFADGSTLSKSINKQAAKLNSAVGTDTITVETTFDVPTEPIPEHNVTVENGTLASGATTGSFAEDASVTVTANAPASDMMFDKWIATGITLTSEQLSSKTFTFTMGTNDVTLTATYKAIPKYTVTVENGKLADGATSGSFKEGESVTITADAKDGFTFDKWTATGITLTSEQLSAQKFTFTMGTNDVTLTATYKAIPKYTVTVENGKLVDGATSGSFKEGESVTITADAKEGFTFDKWTATGITLNSEQLSSTIVTITVGTNNITLTATYTEVVVPAPKYKVTVENGSADGDEFKMGQVVTITANEAPEGKEFDKWVVVLGGVTLDNINRDTTTFIMPSKAVEIKATYKDKTPGGGDNPGGEDNPGSETPGTDEPSGELTPTESKGLNGGAIAGIVVGSVAVVCIGGFAIFWFVIKKKSFAELIAAIKGLFKKK